MGDRHHPEHARDGRRLLQSHTGGRCLHRLYPGATTQRQNSKKSHNSSRQDDNTPVWDPKNPTLRQRNQPMELYRVLQLHPTNGHQIRTLQRSLAMVQRPCRERNPHDQRRSTKVPHARTEHDTVGSIPKPIRTCP